MSSLSLSRTARLLAFAATAGGCTAASSEVGGSSAAQTDGDAVTVPETIGGTVHTSVVVGDARKTPQNLPSPSDSECASPTQSVLGYDAQNFAWFEVKNAAETAASVALSVDGAPDMGLAFFAYASSTAPATLEDAKACVIAGGGDYVNGQVEGAELSTRRGSGLVVPAHGSVFVMLVTGTKTGSFPITVTTEALGPADEAVVTLDPTVGATVTSKVLLSGAARTPTNVPSARDAQCGATARSVVSYNREPFAWLEVKNPGDAAAAISLSLDGTPEMNAAFYAYSSSSPPRSADEVNACSTSSSGSYVGGTSNGPELATSQGSGLVVPAHGSTWVMLMVQGKTGPFTVVAKTETTGAADKATVLVPSAQRAATLQSLLVSGSAKTPANMPSPRDSSCGHAPVSVMSYGPEPSAYVELKNDGDAAAPVAVTLDGPPDSHAAFFAYSSATPPTSADEATACLTSSSGV
jgi:hypothetical protein